MLFSMGTSSVFAVNCTPLSSQGKQAVLGDDIVPNMEVCNVGFP